MISDVQKEAKTKMTKSIQSLEEELARLRAGRASPSLLENVMVTYYGSDVPLMQIASIHVESALMLTVKPWEKHLTPEIEKAIRVADLGLNPATSGDLIRVPLPPLSEERRKELIKKVKVECEDAKIAIRNIRRDANHQFKELKVSTDEQHRAEEEMQKLTNHFVHKIDEIFHHKEKDLMEI